MLPALIQFCIYLCWCSQLVGHGVLPILTRLYLCSYSTEKFQLCERGSVPRISIKTPTTSPNIASKGQQAARLATELRGQACFLMPSIVGSRSDCSCRADDMVWLHETIPNPSRTMLLKMLNFFLLQCDWTMEASLSLIGQSVSEARAAKHVHWVMVSAIYGLS